MRSQLERACAAAILLMTTSCGHQPATTPSGGPAPTPVTLGLDGTWMGKTSQAGAATPARNVDPGYFSFTVFNNRLTSVELQITFEAPCPGHVTSGASSQQGVPIGADGSFALSLGGGETTLATSLSGTFSGRSQAAGSLTVTHRTIACESTHTVTWTASK